MEKQLTPPLPGQLWPEQKGRYAGIMRSEDGTTSWHVIVPEGKKFSFADIAWGEYGLAVKGAKSRFDGHANTLAMAEAGSKLALKIRKLPGDCYLPSRAETALMYATMPEHCLAGWHWTSTQYSDDFAWNQNFSNGNQNNNNNKVAEGRCRAVRRLVLESFNPSTAGAQA